MWIGCRFQFCFKKQSIEMGVPPKIVPKINPPALGLPHLWKTYEENPYKKSLVIKSHKFPAIQLLGYPWLPPSNVDLSNSPDPIVAEVQVTAASASAVPPWYRQRRAGTEKISGRCEKTCCFLERTVNKRVFQGNMETWEIYGNMRLL